MRPFWKHPVLIIFLLLCSLVKTHAVPLTGSTGSSSGVAVKACINFTNNTGQQANDFHIYMFQNDRDHVKVNGADVKVDSNSHPGTTFSWNPPPALGNTTLKNPPPPGNHGVHVNVNMGTPIPAGGTVKVCATLYMNERNCIKYFPPTWTFNGAVLGPAPPPPGGGIGGGGWRINRPFPGGSGGPPDPNGSQGQGAQQGYGGGDGNHVHLFVYHNDSDHWVRLEFLKLLAINHYFPDFENEIDWAPIVPVQNSYSEPPVDIPPGGYWSFAFETAGSYVNGHIYHQYQVVEIPPPGTSSVTDNGATEAIVETVGDHPVDAICSDPGCSTYTPLPTGSCYDTINQTCVADLMEYDCLESYGEDAIWTEDGDCPSESESVPALNPAGIGTAVCLLIGIGLFSWASGNHRRKAGADKKA